MKFRKDDRVRIPTLDVAGTIIEIKDQELPRMLPDGTGPEIVKMVTVQVDNHFTVTMSDRMLEPIEH